MVPTTWIVPENQDYSTRLDRQPFTFMHQLADHPLLCLSRLGDVAHKLAMDGRRNNMIVLGGESATPGTLFSEMLRHEAIADAVTHVSERSIWIKLSSVDAVDVEYDHLAKQLIRDLSALLGTDLTPQLTWYGLTIFIASPRVTTPYHIDHESNFLFQIRGQKDVCIFDQDDRSLLTDQEIERFYTGDVGAARYQPTHEALGTVFNLSSRDAVHHPPLAPHWIRNGDSVSISLSLSFCTHRLDRRARVYQVNHCMRRIGLVPSAPGCNPFIDGIKTTFMNLFSKWRPLNQEELLYAGIKRLTAPAQAINRRLSLQRSINP